MLRLDDDGDELLVIPLGSSREFSGWWNGWLGRDWFWLAGAENKEEGSRWSGGGAMGSVEQRT